MVEEIFLSGNCKVEKDTGKTELISHVPSDVRIIFNKSSSQGNTKIPPTYESEQRTIYIRTRTATVENLPKLCTDFHEFFYVLLMSFGTGCAAVNTIVPSLLIQVERVA